MMTKRLAILGLGSIVAIGAAETVALTDDMEDMSRIAFSSVNVAIDTANPFLFGNDKARLKRWSTESETITYSTKGDLRSFTITAWFPADEADVDFLFAASADNIQFTPALPVKSSGAIGAPWLQAEYALSALPEGTRFLRIGFPEGGTSWAPQIGRVILEHERNDLSLPSLFATNMVLQHGKPVRIWGKSLDHDTVSISFRGTVVRAISENGKWMAEIGPFAPGGPYVMEIAGAASGAQTLRNILVGDVWICSGQSNMWWPLKDDFNAAAEVPAADNQKIRLFSQAITANKSPQYDVSRGAWSACAPASAREFSAVAYYFGKELAGDRKIPVGLVQAAVGGTHIEGWMSEEALQGDPDFAHAMDPAITSKWYFPEVNHPSGPYNAMLHPLMPAGITGILWYQGENNAMDPYTYRKLLPAMIRDWRNGFRQANLPFLVVQLPAYGLDPNWPEMREAQAMAQAAVPNVGMTVNIDLGDSADIHPTRKQPFGARLALLAQGLVYGENLPHRSPLFAHSSLSRDSILIDFEHAGTGLRTTDGKAPIGFEIAGSDSVFHPAHAAIKGTGTVGIWHPQVKNPRLFRYAWLAVPHVNLVNGVKLPAGPFRSGVSAAAGRMADRDGSDAIPTLRIAQAAGCLRFMIHARKGKEAWALGCLFDLRGNLLKTVTADIPRTGSAVLHVETGSLPTGMYLATLEASGERILKRIRIR
jgi:sialate O-acetylesterase